MLARVAGPRRRRRGHGRGAGPAGARRGGRRDAAQRPGRLPQPAPRRPRTGRTPAPRPGQRSAARGPRRPGVRGPAAGPDREAPGHRARRPAAAGPISLRVEADEEELVAGAVRLVLQVHDEQNPLHVCDAALLWTESGRAAEPRVRRPGPHPRQHRAAGGGRRLAGARPAARAAGARRDHARHRRAGQPARGRRRRAEGPRRRRAVAAQPRPRPDRHHGARPRPAGARASSRWSTGCSAPTSLFAFNWQIALHGDPLTEEEMDQLAGVGGADPQAARQLDRHRPRDRPQGAQAAGPHGQARRRRWPRRSPASSRSTTSTSRWSSAPPCSRCASSCSARPTREPLAAAAGADGDPARLPAAGLTWLAEMTSLGLGACLADDMGLGKTVTLIALHLHRAAAPSGTADGRADARGLPGQPARQLGGRDPPVRAGRRRSAASTAPSARCDGARRVRAHDLRHDAPRPRRRWPAVRAGTSWSPTRPSTSRTPGPPPPGRCGPSRARPGWR